MDAELMKIVDMGSKIFRDEDDMKGQMKDWYVGEKARFEFCCPCCQNCYQTEKEYKVGLDYIRDSAKIEIFYKLRSWAGSLFQGIPIVGRFIYNKAWRKLEDREDAVDIKKEEKAKLKAFEEVQDKFMKCTKCGRYSCIACYTDGLCGFCAGTAGIGSELAREFDKQIADAEKMFAKLIEEHPENKEIYMKQLEEQKKQIEEAKQEAERGMREEDS